MSWARANQSCLSFHSFIESPARRLAQTVAAPGRDRQCRDASFSSRATSLLTPASIAALAASVPIHT